MDILFNYKNHTIRYLSSLPQNVNVTCIRRYNASHIQLLFRKTNSVQPVQSLAKLKNDSKFARNSRQMFWTLLSRSFTSVLVKSFECGWKSGWTKMETCMSAGSIPRLNVQYGWPHSNALYHTFVHACERYLMTAAFESCGTEILAQKKINWEWRIRFRSTWVPETKFKFSLDP